VHTHVYIPYNVYPSARPVLQKRIKAVTHTHVYLYIHTYYVWIRIFPCKTYIYNKMILMQLGGSTAATQEIFDTYTHAYVHPYMLFMNSYIFIHNSCIWYILLIQLGGQHSRRITQHSRRITQHSRRITGLRIEPVKSTHMCIYIHKKYMWIHIYIDT